jgi:imidazolonepropionase-like amidohydrolase
VRGDPSGRPVAGRPLAILGAAVWPGDGRPVIDPGAVVVAGGRIVAVGPEAELPGLLAGAGLRGGDAAAAAVAPASAASGGPAAAGVEVVRAGGHTVLPGFVDSHVHLHWSAGASFLREATETPVEDLLLAMARNAQAALRAGITTVRDCGSVGYLALRLRDAIRRGVIAGPRVLACGPAITITGGHLWFLSPPLGSDGMEADTPDALRAAVRRLGKAGVDAIKVCATGGGTPGTNNRRAQYTAEELGVVVREAHRLGLRVAAHCHATEGIRAAVAAGVDCVEHGSWYATDPAAGLEFDEAAASRMAAGGAFHDVTITGQDRAALDEDVVAGLPPARRRALALREARYPLFRRMRDLGVRQMVCTDAGYTPGWGPEWARTLQVLVERAGYAPAEALTMATSTAASALGLDDQVGTIAPGKLADLVLVDGDPLQDIRRTGRVVRVYQEGRPAAPGAGTIRGPGAAGGGPDG